MNPVAKAIFNQLNGNRFVAMTGAKDFVQSENSLQFKLPRVANGVSHVRIVLDCDDTYNMEFLKWNNRKLEMTIAARHTGVYCDMLQELFTNETGLFCAL